MSVAIAEVECGGLRRLAKLRPRPTFGGLPSYAAHRPMIPPGQWYSLGRRQEFPWILEQGRRSSCVGNAVAGALRRARALAGMPDVAFAPGWIYSLINGGADEGARITDAIHAVTRVGALPWGEGFGQDPIFYHDFPDVKELRRIAARYRVLEAYHARTFAEIVSGILLGFVAIFGVHVGSGFERLDRQGIAGHAEGPGNHAVLGDGVTLLADGMWAIDTVNSWGEQFGEGGRCRLDERHFGPGLDPDCYLIRAATEDPGEAGGPPASRQVG